MGQVMSSSPKVVVDTDHAWGYLLPKDFGAWGKDSQFRSYIHFHNGLGIGSIFFSPIAGIIRIFTAVRLLCFIEKVEQRGVKTQVDLTAAKRFCEMQIGRGVMELFCLGPILGTVIDAIMTCKHQKLLFQKD